MEIITKDREETEEFKEKKIVRKTWTEFKNSGMLFFANLILQVFGWSIVIIISDDGDFLDAYPARTKYRGFSEESMNRGYLKISEYMRDHCDELVRDTAE